MLVLKVEHYLMVTSKTEQLFCKYNEAFIYYLLKLELSL